jgi:ComF family protein
MFCIHNCGLLILDLIFDREKVLREMTGLTSEEKYYYLKNLGTVVSKNKNANNKLLVHEKIIKPKIKIIQCENNFHSLGHHLSGANFHIYNYKDERIRDLIRQMKFNENYWVAKFFGYCLARNIYESKIRSKQLNKILSHNAYLIPIPIHWRRFLERGYNQTHWLCHEIVKNLQRSEFKFKHEIKYSKKILKRILYSQKQSWTANEQRAENIRGVFRINRRFKNEINGSNIILIDDVFTTGATINEASRVLMEAGAKNVISFTIAR